MSLNKLFSKFKIVLATASLVSAFGTAGVVVNSSVALAQADNINTQTCEGIKLATGATSCEDSGNTSFSGIIKNVINILSILVGAVSVIMLIIGGFRYIISNGDANSTKAAKDTIMYALIGLIIVLFAQVIVRFVWTNANSTTTNTSTTTTGTP